MTDPTRETTAQMLGLEEPPSSFPSVPDGSGTMFDRIAKDYDRLNRIISLGLDKAWRRKLVRAATRGGGTLFLDLATGTADVAIALAGATPHGRVVGLDPSLGMLQVGREKVDARDWTDRITLVEGDAQALMLTDPRKVCAVRLTIFYTNSGAGLRTSVTGLLIPKEIRP